MHKILVIDDNESLRKNLEAILMCEGYQVLPEPDGLSGLRTARTANPDLVLCDLMMPDLDGFEVSKRLKQDPLTRNIPIIIVSAIDQPREILRGLAYSEEYVTKPFNLDELKARVGSMLRLKTARDEVIALNESLEKRVADRTRELSARNDELRLEIELRRESELLIKSLSQKALTIREEERTRLANVLHDDVGQTIMSLKWSLQSLTAELSSPPNEVESAVQRLSEAVHCVEELADKVRDISHNLSPIDLKNLGLKSAVERVAETFEDANNLTVETNLPGFEPDMPPGNDIMLYRIIQESLTNISRHAGATLVKIEAVRKDNELTLRIMDNGVGCEGTDQPRSGLGLWIMEQHAQRLNAELRFGKSEYGGMEVKLAIPTK